MGVGQRSSGLHREGYGGPGRDGRLPLEEAPGNLGPTRTASDELPLIALLGIVVGVRTGARTAADQPSRNSGARSRFSAGFGDTSSLSERTPMRSRISSAALLENVRARMRFG